MDKLGDGPDERLSVTVTTRKARAYRDLWVLLIDQLKEDLHRRRAQRDRHHGVVSYGDVLRLHGRTHRQREQAGRPRPAILREFRVWCRAQLHRILQSRGRPADRPSTDADRQREAQQLVWEIENNTRPTDILYNSTCVTVGFDAVVCRLRATPHFSCTSIGILAASASRATSNSSRAHRSSSALSAFRCLSSALAVAARCSAACRVALACISASQIVACTNGHWQSQAYEPPVQTTTERTTGTTGTTGGTTGATTGAGSILPPGNWRLVLDDEFNGNSIDQSIWTRIAPDGVGIDSQGCAVNSLAISVGGGFLTLRGVDPSHCPNPNYHPAGVRSSPCAGGEIVTSPIYGPGYYEARLKGAGNYNAFWL
jgi:hypothetical protein